MRTNFMIHFFNSFKLSIKLSFFPALIEQSRDILLPLKIASFHFHVGICFQISIILILSKKRSYYYFFLPLNYIKENHYQILELLQKHQAFQILFGQVYLCGKFLFFQPLILDFFVTKH